MMVATLLAAATFAKGNVYPMTLHKLVDQNGVGGVAFNYLAPKGWKTTAELKWTNALVDPATLVATGMSPDDRFGYLFVSGFVSEFSNAPAYGGHATGIEPPKKLSDFLADYASKLNLTGFRVTGRKDATLTPAQLGPDLNFGMVSSISIGYTLHGKEMGGLFSARMTGFVVGDQRSYEGDWHVTNLLGVLGPSDDVKTALRYFSLAVPTYAPTPGFVRILEAHTKVLMEISKQKTQASIEAINKRAREVATEGREKEDALMSRYWKRQGPHNQAISKFCDYIGDVTRYKNADGSEFQSSSNAGDPWTDGKGNYQFGGNPNEGSGGGWSKLKKADE